MEPQEPARNDESSGFSKRRISSILKAPRKSARFTDPEQQENVVECAKPMEKRNSRRVSFAPANDVLLFSKDVKNASPARSPLQELMAATGATTQNRVQMAVTEDGIQQIMGMETLLNAPLHASQQQDKVNFDTGVDFGEKTVMFSSDDAFMDMTHSHTINISGTEALADISLQNYDILSTGGEKTVMFGADDASMDMTLSQTLNTTNGSQHTGRKMDLGVEKRNISSSIPSLDPGFENFLASLSKPIGPSSLATVETNSSLGHVKTQMPCVDKENQVPTVMEKSLNTSKKTRESSYGSALSPEVDVSMDMTEAQTGRILGFTDDDDPFQCLFPTQEMYAHADKRVSQTTVMKTKQQQSSKTPGYSDPTGMASLKNPSLHASHPRHKVNFDAREECREKTIMFTADDEFMDMTQSHTVNIASGPLASQQMSGAGFDPGFKNFLAGLSKPSGPSVKPVIQRMVPPTAASSKETINTSSSVSQLKTPRADVGKDNRSLNTSQGFGESSTGGAICPENDVSMDMTEAQTGRIIGITGSEDPFQFLFPTQDMYAHSDSLKKAEVTSGRKSSEALGSSNRIGMETSLKPSLKTKVQRHQDKFDAEDDYREKTVRFSTDDACMDVTRSHTVNIATDFKLQSHQNSGFLPSCGEKTVRFSANDAAMDMTQCLTVNIASNLISDSGLPVKIQEGEKRGPPRDRSSSAHGLDSGFNNFLTSLSKPSDSSVDSVIARKTQTAVPSSNTGNQSNVDTICPEDDVSMDMTEAQTGRIIGITDTNEPLQCLFPTQDMYPRSGNLQKTEMTSQLQSNVVPGSSNCKGMENPLKTSLNTRRQTNQVKFDAEDDCREKTVRFSADDAVMDVTRSHTVNIATHFEPQSQPNLGFLPSCGEKTVRFTASDAAMDVTRSHTVNIATDLELLSHKNAGILPSCGEKTVRFTANDAAMDVTRSHTVNIATDVKLLSHQNADILPSCGEKTVRFTASDAAMDVTQSHTVNIATNLELPLHQNVDGLPTYGEKTVRFIASDAAMDVTRSHTVNIASHLGPQPHQNVDILPTCGEKTVRFNANDAAMDMTQCLTVNIASSSVSDSVPPHQDSTHTDMVLPLTVKKRERTRSSSTHGLDPGFKNSLSRKSGPWANPVITKPHTPAAPSPLEGVNTNRYLDQLQTQRSDVDTEDAVLGLVPDNVEKPQNKTMTDCLENSVDMDMTEAQTGRILGQTCTDELPQCQSSTRDSYPSSDHFKQTEAPSQQNNESLGSSSPSGVEITNCPNDSNDICTRKEPEPINETTSLSQKIESSPSAVDQDADKSCSRKSRRMSLADLQSKVRRLSHMINTAPETITVESCTVPLPQLDHDLEKNSKDKTTPLPVVQPELEVGLVNTQDNTQAQSPTQEEASTASTTPFNLKTKQLMSRLSVGGFKPKLPQRSKTNDQKKVNSVGEHTRTMTINVTNQLSNFDNDVSDIYDEELGSYEDMSETLDMRSPQKITEKVGHSLEFNIDESLEEAVFEDDLMSAAHGKKRPLPADENNMEDEKRMKASAEEATDTEMPHYVEYDGNNTTAPNTTTHTTDYSSSGHTASIRCEATFESTFKQSMIESQLEDYENDAQKKMDDGTITVLEFFKLFNIDFVIHNPRQSVLPGRLLSDTDRTPMDLLKDKHISRPKQMVYETNVQNLTEKVEGLKARMRDLDKPLKIVNRPLWEEMRSSSEKELKSFGAKLKERNNLFRKTSKAQSHEMKEVLYSNLVQANLEEQQKLRGKIEEADEMIKSLDNCICELETELAAVEEKGSEEKPSLKLCQEEMKKVTEALADNERQMSELELQKMQNSNKLNRLKAETRNLESHVAMLHMVNEWKFGEKKENYTTYTFLHETMHLQLVYEKSGADDGNQSERKISHISFKLQLDDEKSQCHARLVHKLLSQYIESEPSWVEKYPTSRHVPKLLHDVGLVVSRCRLLGEELRLLKMWGGLRLDILDISCVDALVHIVFSSLKKFSKFEVVFSVSLINHLCVLQVESFKNTIGNTKIQQIEEIVALFSPAKNVLTKIVKKIHDNLLC